MEMEATPRPWKYPFGGAIVTVAGGLYDKVTVVSGEMRQEDAALIVEAVNNYDRLRAVEAAARALVEGQYALASGTITGPMPKAEDFTHYVNGDSLAALREALQVQENRHG